MVGDDSWWESHWDTGPSDVRAFLGEDGIELIGRSVADLGCGDGIMTAGLARLTGAAVVGFDLDLVDRVALERAAQSRGVDLSDLNLEFRKASPGSIEADDAEFDLGVSWSVMEHVFDREGYMREARRVIKPNGLLFVQVWPLWHSEHGHHLARWLSPYDHLRYGRDGIEEKLRGLEQLPGTPEGGAAPTLREVLRESGWDMDKWLSATMASYDSCNGVTLDEIQTLLLEHGFGIGRVEVLTGPFHVPPDLQSFPLSRLALNGFKLAAWRKT